MLKYKHFGLCSAHRRVWGVAAINENFGIKVAYMIWSEQRAIENVGSTDIPVRNIYL